MGIQSRKKSELDESGQLKLTTSLKHCLGFDTSLVCLWESWRRQVFGGSVRLEMRAGTAQVRELARANGIDCGWLAPALWPAATEQTGAARACCNTVPLLYHADICWLASSRRRAGELGCHQRGNWPLSVSFQTNLNHTLRLASSAAKSRPHCGTCCSCKRVRRAPCGSRLPFST